MLSGVEVTVSRPVVGAVDRLGNPTYTTTDETVGNVLVAPGSTEELDASRPAGVSVAYTLHFPKAYTGNLRGCTVTLPEPWAGTYRVIGDPRPYMDANTPTEWNRPVEVEDADG